MEKHTYTLLKGSWGISITIFGRIFDKAFLGDDSIIADDGIYLSFSKEPLIRNEIFCKEDRESIFKAVKMVRDYIVSNSPFHNNTVIQICSLQYSLCYYQEEAMIAAMLNWCSKTFHFELKRIDSRFDYENNKYIFDFHNHLPSLQDDFGIQRDCDCVCIGDENFEERLC